MFVGCLKFVCFEMSVDFLFLHYPSWFTKFVLHTGIKYRTISTFIIQPITTVLFHRLHNDIYKNNLILAQQLSNRVNARGYSRNDIY